MQISFVTGNRHKFEEAEKILAPYGVTLTRDDTTYPEEQDRSLEEIATWGAKMSAEELQVPVITEDTGIFFEAYPGFPGVLAKPVIDGVGIDGVFRLLEGLSRAAYFETVAAFCMPGMSPLAFHGILRGTITKEVHNAEAEGMPYDKIFIPEGKDETISAMSIEAKNTISQRAAAFQKLGEHIAAQYA